MVIDKKRPLIFISYSSVDIKIKEFVQRHLAVLQTLGDIEVWEDSQIGLGDDWFQEIQTKLKTCSVAVLLISHDFLGSQFCVKKEVPVLLERRMREGMMIAPILLSPCAWEIVPWLSAIQMLPRKGTPLLALDEREQAEKLTETVVAIHSFLEKEKAKVASTETKEAIAGLEIEVKADTPYAKPLNIDLSRLPASGFDVVGRDNKLQALNEAFHGSTFNIISLRAWGGVGKSTLVNKWCQYLAADNFYGARRVFAWSFYSQGTNERATSADAFINEALRFFGEDGSILDSPWAKGERLAGLVGKEKSLLILDGMEPMQDAHQGIKDPALERLVECLAEQNAGLCVITTREPIIEFCNFPETTWEVDLEQLSKEAGRALLRIRGLRAEDDLLELASFSFGNHALALNLLASFLKRFAGGNVSKALEIPDLPDVMIDAGRHPRRVMMAFADQFGEGPELDLLHVMGLFDRPADAGCITALREPPIIRSLTDHIIQEDDGKLASWWRRVMGKDDEPSVDAIWENLLAYLRSLGLLAEMSHHAPLQIDAHPLIREHFGSDFAEKKRDAWKAGHDRLYKHLESRTENQPVTLADMAPLFQAVRHGCKAGHREQVMYEVYRGRIVRKGEDYLVKKLGAVGADLGLLTLFFDLPFEHPSADFPESAQAWLLNQAAYRLRALGRLREAAAPMLSSLVSYDEQENWRLAAIVAANLSELQLALGDVTAAVMVGENPVGHADRGGDKFQHVTSRIKIADAQHQAGAYSDAEALYVDAEQRQAAYDADHPRLYSFNGYCYCDLLLSLGQADSVRNRASYALDIVEKGSQNLLDIALNHLALGRAALTLEDEGKAHMLCDQAVEGLRAAGHIEFIPRGLLARAVFSRVTQAYEQARRDIAEVMRIATRSGMLLHECDAHLEYARLSIAEGNSDNAVPHFKSATALVTDCGYHRRDGEVADLKETLGL